MPLGTNEATNYLANNNDLAFSILPILLPKFEPIPK